MKKVVYYRMVIFYIVLFSINSLATAIVASFMNNEWFNMSYTTRFLVVVIVIQNWTGTLLAFFNKSVSNVESGKTIFDVPVTPKQDPPNNPTHQFPVTT
jgi:hypothetical protein